MPWRRSIVSALREKQTVYERLLSLLLLFFMYFKLFRITKSNLLPLTNGALKNMTFVIYTSKRGDVEISFYPWLTKQGAQTCQ